MPDDSEVITYQFPSPAIKTCLITPQNTGQIWMRLPRRLRWWWHGSIGFNVYRTVRIGSIEDTLRSK